MDPIIDGVLRELEPYKIYNIVSFKLGDGYRVKTVLARSKGEFWRKVLKDKLITTEWLTEIESNCDFIIETVTNFDNFAESSVIFSFGENCNELEVKFGSQKKDDLLKFCMDFINCIWGRIHISNLGTSIRLKLDELVSNWDKLEYKELPMSAELTRFKADCDLARGGPIEYSEIEKVIRLAGKKMSYKYVALALELIKLMDVCFNEPEKLLDFFVCWEVIESLHDQYNETIWADPRYYAWADGGEQWEYALPKFVEIIESDVVSLM